jgi:hypothetical protein
VLRQYGLKSRRKNQHSATPGLRFILVAISGPLLIVLLFLESLHNLSTAIESYEVSF